MSFTVEQAARLYRMPIVDYHRGRGVLISSGCGIMMAVMDQVPFRWCFDTDRLDAGGLARLPDFAELAGAVTPIAICGWFSYSNPAPLAEAMRRAGSQLCYAGHVRFGIEGEATTLEEFLERCRASIG